MVPEKKNFSYKHDGVAPKKRLLEDWRSILSNDQLKPMDSSSPPKNRSSNRLYGSLVFYQPLTQLETWSSGTQTPQHNGSILPHSEAFFSTYRGVCSLFQGEPRANPLPKRVRHPKKNIFTQPILGACCQRISRTKP